MRKNHARRAISIVLCAMVLSGLVTGCSSSKEIDPFDYIELGDYKGLDVEYQVHEVTEEEIEDELNALVAAYSEPQQIKYGVVQEGDTANIDYVGKRDGVAFEGGTGYGYDLVIGSGTFIPGFEAGLIGAEIGNTVDLNLTFPENYHSLELAGADVVFTVTINYVLRREVPEITDDFINEISAGNIKTVDDYRQQLEEQIVSEYDDYNELQYYKDLWDKAVENATVIKDLPSDMINDKISKMVINSQQYAKSYGLSFDDFVTQYMGISPSEFNAEAAKYAKQATKESLVLKAIALKEGISVSEDEMDAAIDEYTELGNYESREKFLEQADLKELEEFVLQSKVEDFLAANAAK